MSLTNATASQARRRNARGEGALLRGEILAAAAEILDETGDEHAVTLRAVARKIGIAAPSIYAHFADRYAILMALVLEGFASLEDRLTRALDQAGSDSVERLEALSKAYLTFAADEPRRYKVMFGGIWDASEAVDTNALTKSEMETLGQDTLGLLTEAMREAVADGRAVSDDPPADATALWLCLHGLAYARATLPFFPFPPDIVDRVVRPAMRLV